MSPTGAPPGFPPASQCFAEDFTRSMQALRARQDSPGERPLREWQNAKTCLRALGAQREQVLLDRDAGTTLWVWRLPSGDLVVTTSDGVGFAGLTEGLLQ